MAHIREITAEGYRIQLDLSEQELGLNVPEEEGHMESPLHPTFPRSGLAGFASAGALALKAKQFDDGLYAATDLAAQNGAGRFPGKVYLLRALAQSLVQAISAETTQPLSVLYGACELGGLKAGVPPALAAAVQEEVAGFLGNELRSKPIGFYTWNQDLEAIFRQDRMLQSPLRSEAGIEALVQALQADYKLRGTYESYLHLVARLTNPFKESDYRSLLADKSAKQDPRTKVCFFPPSRAHETDLVEKLYGNRPIPDGFNLMNELIARIRSGGLSLKPTAQSGWYDHQIWSIEPLAIPVNMPEAKHLWFDERYREHLLELFKGIYALARETHIKQLDVPYEGAALGFQEAPVEISIAPELSAEPLVTFYFRRALSYRFVRKVLEETFDSEGLRHMRRLTAKGPGSVTLDEELAEMEALFYGAHVTVSRQLGMDADSSCEVGSGKGMEADAERFQGWIKNLKTDADLGQDCRMMVPVFYDLARRQTKVWVFLGWTHKPVHIYFGKPPRVVSIEEETAEPAPGRILQRWFGKQGQVKQRPQPKIEFTAIDRELATPVTAELYVDKILNRDEFRKCCDKYMMASMILGKLRGDDAASP